MHARSLFGRRGGLAVAVAANRRGCVCTILCPFKPRPSSRHIFGNCVVLPEPVSPHTITTWFAAIKCLISARLCETGSSSGYRISGGDWRVCSFDNTNNQYWVQIPIKSGKNKAKAGLRSIGNYNQSNERPWLPTVYSLFSGQPPSQ